MLVCYYSSLFMYEAFWFVLLQGLYLSIIVLYMGMVVIYMMIIFRALKEHLYYVVVFVSSYPGF